MKAILTRNLKLYFRDKTSVFFSLLAVFIVIGLYALFLGDNLRKQFDTIPDADIIINTWVMAGILSVASITTTLGAFGTMVDDKMKKIIRDFESSPIQRYKLAAGYILSSFVIGVIMSVITFIVGETYIIISGGEILSFVSILKVLGLILLSVLSSTSMMFFVVSLFRSHSAFTTASTVIGTLIGFITGIYIPIGTLPAGVQLLIKVFPVSHSASLFRQVMLENPMEESFKNAPESMINDFNLEMGNYFQFGDYTTTIVFSIIVLIITAIIFYALSILNMTRKSYK